MYRCAWSLGGVAIWADESIVGYQYDLLVDLELDERGELTAIEMDDADRRDRVVLVTAKSAESDRNAMAILQAGRLAMIEHGDAIRVEAGFRGRQVVPSPHRYSA
jgi:hypothetical protein